jgi:hypothetical protein
MTTAPRWTSGHDYGPHRPEDAPTTVEVGPAEKWAESIDVPISKAVLKQREQINTIAHERAGR